MLIFSAVVDYLCIMLNTNDQDALIRARGEGWGLGSGGIGQRRKGTHEHRRQCADAVRTAVGVEGGHKGDKR